MKNFMQTGQIVGKIQLILLIMLVAFSGISQAQIEEIVVTAQKRAEDIQDVPISISAFSGDFMEESGVNTLQELGAYTPNLTLTQSSQVANNRIIIRGVGSVGNSAIEPSVAVFIDGVYYPRPSSVVGSLTDLEAVEVLRGPQGTLFGRNASMGALNIRTRRPGDELEGYLRASYGNYDAWRVSGAAGGPLGEAVSGRVSFQYSDREGFGNNSFTDSGKSEQIGDWQDMSLRGKLFFTPSDDFDITLTVDYEEVNNGGPVVEIIPASILPSYSENISRILSSAATGPFPPTGPSGPLPALKGGLDYNVNQDHRDDAKDKQWGLAADANWRLGEHTIRSISAYRDWSNDTFESAFRLPLDLVNRISDYEVETLSQELQLLSPVGGRLEYVAGFYYYKEDYTIDQALDGGSDFCSPAFGNLVQLNVARQAIPQLIRAFIPLLGTQAPNVAQAIVTGAISDGPTLDAAFSLRPGTGAALLAQTPPTARARNLGGAATAQCNAIEAGLPTTAASVNTAFGQDVTSIAAFGQATFNVTDDLKLTGGVRWTKDDKDGFFTSMVNNRVLAPLSPTNPFGVDLRANENEPALDFSEDKITWMANASYQLNEDIMLFGTYATGYKSGGFNSDGFNSIGLAAGARRVFASETVDNFEFGFKSTLLDNRLRANLAYFHTQIDDFQDRQFDGINFFVQNAGELTQQGVELDVQARPLDQLFVLLGLSYLDSSFDSFPNATNLPAVVADTQDKNNIRLRAGQPPLPVPPRDLSGQRNHFSPKWQASLVAEWSDLIPNTAMGWFVRGEYQYLSKQNIGAETNQNPQSLQAAYSLFNARVGLRAVNKGWEFSAFVRNAGDKAYCQTAYNQPIGTTLGLVDPATGGGLQRCILGAPRTWGVEATYRF